MEITKKNLLSLIKENLNEMAMDFDSADRPNVDVTEPLKTGETPLKKVPLPNTGNVNQNFQEMLASERYKEVISNLRRYTGLNDVLSSNVHPNNRLMMMMMDAHNRIINIERNHKEELVELAIDLVCEYMGMTRDDINFNVSLSNPQEINIDDFERDQPNEENPEEVNVSPEAAEQQENEVELFVDLERLNLARAKQRLLNAIMQGASKKGHFLYHEVEEKL